MGRRHVRALVLVACTLPALAGCGGEESGEESGPQTVLGARGAIEFTATPLAPPAEGPNDFRLALRQLSSGEPLAGATIDVGAVMPSMGHEAQGEPSVDEGEPGVYDVRDVVFSMPGTWEVRFRAEAASVEDEAAFDYEVR